MSSPIGQNSVVVVPGVLPAQMEEERKTSTTGADAGDGPREAAPTAPDATTITTTTNNNNDNKGRGRPRGSTKRPRDESARSGHKAMEYVERDAQKVAQPDISTPFHSLDDVIERLLPYHILASPASVEVDRLESEQTGARPAVSRRESHAIMSEKSSTKIQNLAWDLQNQVHKCVQSSLDRNRISELVFHLLTEEDIKRQVDAEKAYIAAIEEAEEEARLAAMEDTKPQSTMETDGAAQASDDDKKNLNFEDVENNSIKEGADKSSEARVPPISSTEKDDIITTEGDDTLIRGNQEKNVEAPDAHTIENTENPTKDLSKEASKNNVPDRRTTAVAEVQNDSREPTIATEPAESKGISSEKKPEAKPASVKNKFFAQMNKFKAMKRNS